MVSQGSHIGGRTSILMQLKADVKVGSVCAGLNKVGGDLDKVESMAVLVPGPALGLLSSATPGMLVDMVVDPGSALSCCASVLYVVLESGNVVASPAYSAVLGVGGDPDEAGAGVDEVEGEAGGMGNNTDIEVVTDGVDGAAYCVLCSSSDAMFNVLMALVVLLSWCMDHTFTSNLGILIGWYCVESDGAISSDGVIYMICKLHL